MRAAFLASLHLVGGLLATGCREEPDLDHPGVDEQRLEELIEAYRDDPDRDRHRREAEPAQRPIPVEEARDEPAPPTPTVELAAEAWRAIVAEAAEGEADAYFAHFQDPVPCFDGRADVPLATARNTRFATTRPGRGIVHLQPIRSSADEVEFVEYGWTGAASDLSARLHRWRVVLRRSGERWWVTALARDRGSLCGAAAAEAPSDPFFEALERGWQSHLGRCEGREGRPARGRCDPASAMPEPAVLCRPRLGCPLTDEMPCPGLAACREHLQQTIDAFLGTSAE